MNTKSDNSSPIQNLIDALQFNSPEEKFDHDAQMLSFKFLSEIERLMDDGEIVLNKKELAKRIGTSSSYVTQLFRGNKLLNFQTLAKIQEALNIVFEIRGKKINEGMTESDFAKIIELSKTTKRFLWVSKGESDAKKYEVPFETGQTQFAGEKIA